MIYLCLFLLILQMQPRMCLISDGDAPPNGDSAFLRKMSVRDVDGRVFDLWNAVCIKLKTEVHFLKESEWNLTVNVTEN